MTMITFREPRNVFSVPSVFGRVFNDPFFAAALGATNGACQTNGQAGQVDEGALALDISEDENSLIVRASLPGFTKENVDVEVHEGVLSIKATHADQAEEKGETFLRRERRTRSLERRISLPPNVEGNEGEAELKDGVLTLRLAKVPTPQPRKLAVK